MTRRAPRKPASTFERWLREHALFLVCIRDLHALPRRHGRERIPGVQRANGWSTPRRPITFGEYLGSGQFVEATFENWESEFLQMGAYVVLTIFLFQKGSSESKPIDARTRAGRRPPAHADHARHAVAGTARAASCSCSTRTRSRSSSSCSSRSRSGCTPLGGAEAYSAEQAQHGLPGLTPIEYLGTAQFWFESMQNWQSEFLAVAAIVGASVYLRQRGSPESKPVATPHHETGT